MFIRITLFWWFLYILVNTPNLCENILPYLYLFCKEIKQFTKVTHQVTYSINLSNRNFSHCLVVLEHCSGTFCIKILTEYPQRNIKPKYFNVLLCWSLSFVKHLIKLSSNLDAVNRANECTQQLSVREAQQNIFPLAFLPRFGSSGKHTGSASEDLGSSSHRFSAQQWRIRTILCSQIGREAWLHLLFSLRWACWGVLKPVLVMLSNVLN